MKKLLKSHAKSHAHDDNDSSSPFVASSRERIFSEQLPVAAAHSHHHYRNSLAAYPASANDDHDRDDLSSWELVQQNMNHPYRRSPNNDRDRSASFASFSGSGSPGSNSTSTLPNPYAYSHQQHPQRPYTRNQPFSASRASSLNSLQSQHQSQQQQQHQQQQHSPHTSTTPLVTSTGGGYAPSPTSPASISGGALANPRKKAQPQAHSQAQSSTTPGGPIPTAPSTATATATPQLAQQQASYQPPSSSPSASASAPQATAAILRALDPSMGILSGAAGPTSTSSNSNMAAAAVHVLHHPPQHGQPQQLHKTSLGLVSRPSIRSRYREGDRERDRERGSERREREQREREQREWERQLHVQQQQQQQQQQEPSSLHPLASHGHHPHLRVPILSHSKSKSKSHKREQRDRNTNRDAQYFPHTPQSSAHGHGRGHSRSRSRSGSRSLSDMEFNERAGRHSVIDPDLLPDPVVDIDVDHIDSSPPSSASSNAHRTHLSPNDHHYLDANANSTNSSRRPSSVYDPYTTYTPSSHGTDLDRDSFEMERREREKEREARWRERDLEIEGKIPVPLSGQTGSGTGSGPRLRKGKEKDKDKDKEKDKDRDSRGFFERLQFGDGREDTVRDHHRERDEAKRKDKKEKEDWKTQITSIFSGKDKDKEHKGKKHKDEQSSSDFHGVTPYSYAPIPPQKDRPEISAPVASPYAHSHPYAATHGQTHTPPNSSSNTFTADLASAAGYHVTPASNAPLFFYPQFVITNAQLQALALAHTQQMQQAQMQMQSQTQMQTREIVQAGVTQDNLARMVGLFVSPSLEGIDWALALELCEQTKVTGNGPGSGSAAAMNDTGGRERRESTAKDVKEAESNAKIIAKALRKELKYARPSEQLGAVTLWAVMLQNASDFFITQTSSRKFLDVVEDVIVHSRNFVIRERLLEVLGAAAYLANQKGSKDASKRENFKTVWKKVKPETFPDEGMPLSMDNPMFHSQPSTLQGSGDGDGQRSRPAIPQRRSSRNGIIPVDEDIRRLFQECKIGRGNAQLLNEALAFASPEDLKEKDIIKEFYAKCRASQELIHAQIPWASAGAERSRIHQFETLAPDQNIDDVPPTREEKLLGELLATNEELAEALRIYDDIERIGMENEAERRARERSKVEVRANPMDYQLSGEDANFLAAPSIAPSSSRSQSPSSFLMNSQLSQTSNTQSTDPKYFTDPVPASAAALYQQQQQTQPHQLPQVPQTPAVLSGSDSSHSLTTHSHIHSQSQNHTSLPHAPSHLAPAPNRLLHGPRSPPPSGAAAAAAAAGVTGAGGVHSQSRTNSPSHASRPNSVVHSRATSLDTDLDKDGTDKNARLERETSDQTVTTVQTAVGTPKERIPPEYQEPVQLSEKAAGKRRMVEYPSDLHVPLNTPNGAANVLHTDDISLYPLRSELETDTDENYPDDENTNNCAFDRWKPKIHYAYDAAAERTKERLRELAIAGH